MEIREYLPCHTSTWSWYPYALSNWINGVADNWLFDAVQLVPGYEIRKAGYRVFVSTG